MKLRTKVSLILGLLILALVAGLYAVLSWLTLSDYARLEHGFIRRDLNRISKALDGELKNLNATTGDWANWDATYRFAGGEEQSYLGTSIFSTDLVNIDASYILILDNSKHPLLEEAINKDNGESVPLPQGLDKYISSQSPLLNQLVPGEGKTGFMLLQEGPMLVSVWPILNSDWQGPSTGTLILGKFLDTAMINRLELETETTFAIDRNDANQVPGEIQTALDSLDQNIHFLVRVISADTIAAYTRIRDINGDLALTLMVSANRDIYQQGKLALDYILLALVLLGFGFGAIATIGMQKMVVIPLARLTQDITRLSDTQDFSGRLSVGSQDEIGELAVATNKMLGRILDGEEKYSLLVSQAGEGIVTIDLNNQISFANPRLAEMLGYTVEELQGKDFLSVTVEPYTSILTKGLENSLKGMSERYDLKLLHKDGPSVMTSLSVSPMRGASGHIAGSFAIIEDITERMQAIETTNRTLALLQSSLEATLDGLLIVDLSGKVVLYNQRFARIWHIPRDILDSSDDAKLLAYVLSQLKDPQGFGKKVQELYSSVDEESRDFIEFKDGRVVERYSAPHKLAGKAVGRVWSFRDITEQVKAEAALLESEERYRTLVDNLGEGSAFVDAEENFTLANPAAERIYGVPPGGLIGRNIREFLPLDQLEIVMAQTQKRRSGEHDSYELEIMRPDGEKHTVLVTTTPKTSPEGKFEGTWAIFRDITDRILAEKALRKKQQELQIILNSVQTPVWFKDTNNNYIRVSPAAAASVNMAVEVIEGKSAYDIFPEDADRIYAEDIEIINSGQPKLGYVRSLNIPGRGIKWYLTDKVPYSDDQGNITGVVVFDTDITDRIRAENLQKSLYRISETAHNVRNFDELYRSIHEIISALLPANNLFISLYDPVTNIISYPYIVDESETEPPLPRQFGKGLTEYVLKTGEPLLALPDVFDDLVARGEVESIGTPSVDWLGVPLKTQDKVIGVLAVQTYAEGIRYTEEQKNILLFVSSQIAMAIERVAAEEALRLSEERLRKFMDSAVEAFVLFDAQMNIVDLNQIAESQFGLSRPALIGQNLLKLVPSIQDIGMYDNLFNVLYTGKSLSLNDLFIPALFGEKIMALDAFVVGDGLGLIIRDITEQKMSELRLQYAATHDSLTGLPNRSLFQDRLDHAINRARRNNDKVAVMFVDLDGFKAVNDTYGHAAGDLLLTAIAERLVSYLRKSDTVSRLGGDEYTILVENGLTTVKLETLAEKILEGIARPFLIGNQEIHVTASIGISIYPKDGEDPEGLLQKADAAMYKSKEKHDNGYMFYS